MTETKLDFIRDAVSESALFEIAAHDCIAAMMRRATLGRSIADATTQLELLRQQFEGTAHDRPRQIIRIRLRRT